METFRFTASLTISTYTSVEAETLEEALQIAKQRHDLMSIASNNGDSEDEVWMIDELDGYPYNIQPE